MPDPTRAHCQRCGGHRDQVGAITWGGNCITCAELEQTANIVGLATKTGEPWARWRAAMAACVGAVIPSRETEAA